jgi:two-component system KDP operon response regulator KdpE
MPTVWIRAQNRPQLFEVFQTAGWVVKTRLLSDDPDSRSVRDPDLIVYDLTDQQLTLDFQWFCTLKMSPLLAVATGWDQAWQAIEAGADDVVIHLDDPAELLFRARRLLHLSQIVRVHELSIDLAARRVKQRGQVIRLAPLEYRVLACLACHVGEAVSVDQILEEVWDCGSHDGGSLDQVKNVIKRLRKKIELDPTRPEYLLTVKGFGYRLRSQLQWEDSMLRRTR